MADGEPEPQPGELRAAKLTKSQKKEAKKAARKAAKAESQCAAAGGGGDGGAMLLTNDHSHKSSALPAQLKRLLAEAAARDPRVMPAVEREHVQAVYDTVAEQWDGDSCPHPHSSRPLA